MDSSGSLLLGAQAQLDSNSNLGMLDLRLPSSDGGSQARRLLSRSAAYWEEAEVKEALTKFAKSQSFLQTLRTAFGNSFSVEKAQDLRHQWATGSFTDLPVIQIRTAAELKSARSAFSAETNTIYVSQDYVKQNAAEHDALTGLFLEEFGHFIDSKINKSDTAGDEGAIFSALLQGVNLSQRTLQQLKTEDDRASISLNGKEFPVEQATLDAGNGLRGDYYNSANLTGFKKASIISPTVNFNWGKGSPDAAIAPNTFSARWIGQVQPKTSGIYTFYTQADDGIQLWVNGQRLISNLTKDTVSESKGTIALIAGQKYDIKLKYYENTGSAAAKLLWSSLGQAKEIIPQSQLFFVPINPTPLPTASLDDTIGTPVNDLLPSADENIVFPTDAGVLNAKDFGAKGDGVTDDTVAIQALLNAYPNGQRIIYLPNGTYLVSDRLSWPAGKAGTGNEYKNTILQGQSQSGVTIKLKNGAAGFTDLSKPKSVIFTGPAPAQRFGNSIRNLTVDTGIDNPGAIGIQFNASNQGSMRQVTIQSGDGQGVNGLDMEFTDEIGPLLVKGVTVKGFQYGIVSGNTVNSQTFEDIRLENQSVYGFRNYGQVINIRNLTSNNAVTAIYSGIGSTGHMTLIDSSFNGIGGALSSSPAIRNDGTLLARNITTSGYQSAIQSGSKTLVEPSVSEFVSGPVSNLFPSPQQTLNLPIKETPEIPWDNPLTTPWANVMSYGAIPNDGLDDTVAIQAAIDSGRTTVYLPVGNYNLQNTIFVRNNVRRIIGTEATVEVPNLVNPGFKVVDGTSPTVVIERIQSGYAATPTFENASSRTLVIRDALNVSGNMTGAGDVFIENVVSNPSQSWTFNGQNVWARQLNVENAGTHIMNNGGNLWILGLKTERGGTLIDTRNGGKTEVLGGLAYTTTAGPDDTQNYPMFINDESSVSISLAEVNYGAPSYATYVRETRGGITREISSNKLPDYLFNSLGSRDIPLYVGY
jgi:PA14 domain/Pectate lyase superfamily protein